MTLVRALFCLGLVSFVPACPGEDDTDGDGTTTTSGRSNEPDDVQLAVDGGGPDACDDEGGHDLPPVE